MHDDATTVRRLLRAAGFDAPEEDIAALAQSYGQTRAMAASLFAVAETRYESPASGLRVDPRHVDWWERESRY